MEAGAASPYERLWTDIPSWSLGSEKQFREEEENVLDAFWQNATMRRRKIGSILCLGVFGLIPTLNNFNRSCSAE